MKVHHATNTRSVRAVRLLEELGIPYEVETYKLGDPAMRSPDYLKVHPMGRVPALEDGDVTIWTYELPKIRELSRVVAVINIAYPKSGGKSAGAEVPLVGRGGEQDIVPLDEFVVRIRLHPQEESGLLETS